MSKEPLKNPKRRTLTKRLVQDALLEILKTKSIMNVTVRELCDAAGINRTTFYNHYNGVYEVLSEIEENFLTRISAEDALFSNEQELTHHIERLCIHLKENSDIAVLLLENNADPNFSSRLMNVQSESTTWQKTMSRYSDSEKELLIEFVSGGAYKLICRWLKTGCKQTPHQIAVLFSRIIKNGLSLDI